MTTTTIEQFREQCAKPPTEIEIITAAEQAGLWPNTICAWLPAFHRYHAIMSKRVLALPLPVMPEQAEPVAKRELIDLYKAVNEMMLAIGMFGSIESDNECVTNVMNALYALDDGSAVIRANDLVEKAFMPFNQAFQKAVQEYIDKLEGRLDRYEMLARIAELEAENQKLKEDAAWIPIEQCRYGKPVIVKIDDVVQHVIVTQTDDDEWTICENDEVIDCDFHPSHFKYLPKA